MKISLEYIIGFGNFNFIPKQYISRVLVFRRGAVNMRRYDR
jgi:hypothetical protein